MYTVHVKIRKKWVVKVQGVGEDLPFPENWPETLENKELSSNRDGFARISKQGGCKWNLEGVNVSFFGFSSFFMQIVFSSKGSKEKCGG